jgi:hypothetical protein
MNATYLHNETDGATNCLLLRAQPDGHTLAGAAQARVPRHASKTHAQGSLVGLQGLGHVRYLGRRALEGTEVPKLGARVVHAQRVRSLDL